MNGMPWRSIAGRAILEALHRRAQAELGRGLRIEAPDGEAAAVVPRVLLFDCHLDVRAFSVDDIGRAEMRDARGLAWLHSRATEMADALGVQVHMEERLDDVRLHLSGGG